MGVETSKQAITQIYAELDLLAGEIFEYLREHGSSYESEYKGPEDELYRLEKRMKDGRSLKIRTVAMGYGKSKYLEIQLIGTIKEPLSFMIDGLKTDALAGNISHNDRIQLGFGIMEDLMYGGEFLRHRPQSRSFPEQYLILVRYAQELLTGDDNE